MMQKVFILFYSSDSLKIEKFPFDKKMARIMEKIFSEGKNRGVDFYRAHIDWFDPACKKFIKCWAFKDGKWSIVFGVQPDVVFDRCPYSLDYKNTKVKIASFFKFVNNPKFDEIVSDKYSTYLLFNKWMPKTFLLNNNEELNEKLNNFNDFKKIVVKPLNGYGGEGVSFFNKKNVKKIKINQPSILQEFIDSSSGLRGVVKGNHDLRILIFGKEIFGAYVRVPRRGCLCANIAQGGKRIVIKKEDIPIQALSISQEVIKTFAAFDDSFYSIDFIFDKKQTPFIMELNSRPGLVFGEGKDKDFFDSYTIKVIEHIKNINRKN